MADEPETPDQNVDESATDEPLGEAGKRALDNERVARREADQKAKAAEERAVAIEKELSKLKRQSLSESDRAVEEARTAGAAEATATFGARLARAEFDKLAARRNSDVDTTELLEYVDLSRFVGADGEPDGKAIEAAVNRLVPEKEAVQASTSLDLGQRSPAARGKSTGDMFAATIQSLL